MRYDPERHETRLASNMIRIEVEHKKEVSPLKSENLISNVFVVLIWPFVLKGAGLCRQFYHRLVEVSEEAIPKIRVVPKAPLTTSIVVRPIISFSREVYPFGVPKFVPHKSEVSIPSGPKRNEPDHFMKSYRSIDNKALIGRAHLPVHLLIGEPEDEGLIPDESLVVRLRTLSYVRQPGGLISRARSPPRSSARPERA